MGRDNDVLVHPSPQLWSSLLGLLMLRLRLPLRLFLCIWL